MMEKRPLISFIICCYKQESIVANAVRMALAQSYSPLEVIISDDCSPDRTYEEICRVIEETPSPHRVIPFRMPRNHGLVPHFNHLVTKVSSGELIVCGAGDDMSAPDRVEKMWEFWEKSGHRYYSVTCGVRRIDCNGEELPPKYPPMRMVEPGELVEAFESNRLFVSGCAQMFHRDVYREFGELRTIHVEDTGIAFRAAILGGVGYLNDLLVISRAADGSLSFESDYKKRIARNYLLGKETFDQYRRDLKSEAAKKRLPDQEIDVLQRIILAREERISGRYRCAFGSAGEKIAAWSRMLFRQSLRNSLKDLSLLLPETIYKRVRLLWMKYK